MYPTAPTSPAEAPARTEPPAARTFSRVYPGTASQVRQARLDTEDLLSGHPKADEAGLLVHELAANAVLYSASGQPGGTFTVRVEAGPDAYVRAEVEDQGSAWDGDLGNTRRCHGLYLLHCIATECGTRRVCGGWIVWFALMPESQ